jgi:hypothetical protein
MKGFETSVARKQLSEYAFENTHEMAAELWAVAFHPGLDLTALPDALAASIRSFKQMLKDTGNWIDNSPNPLAGKTVREANAIQRGTVYAEQKAALLPQDILDRFHEQFVGKGKHVESNPDVARTAQMFGKWTDAVVTNGLLKGGSAVHSGILSDIAGLPTASAVPYNFTEGMAQHIAYSSMARKWDDAYRLQYFAQERSMLERTINHPMFGLYPASYMWGKIMPEVVRFLAAEEAGHSQALSFGGYLLPTLPWDISASAPAWMRNIADQGLKGEKSVEAGGPAEPFNALAPVTDTIKKLNPLETTLPWAARAVGEVQGPSSEAQRLKDAQDHDKLVQASELQDTLQETMRELQEALSR